MEIGPALERTLRGKVKPSTSLPFHGQQESQLSSFGAVITQCSIRHLYALSAADVPAKDRLIEIAKTLERRKCNHHELAEPLPERECFESVVVITANGQNKHRYVLACQDHAIRQLFRDTPGVPSVTIHRSVMILEPMNDASRFRREGVEREKFLSGIADARAAERLLLLRKRKRDGDGEDGEDGTLEEGGEEEKQKKKKKKQRGPKGPNPLSVKKKKIKEPTARGNGKPRGEEPLPAGAEPETSGQVRKRRKRKHRKGGDNDPPAQES